MVGTQQAQLIMVINSQMKFLLILIRIPAAHMGEQRRLSASISGTEYPLAITTLLTVDELELGVPVALEP